MGWGGKTIGTLAEATAPSRMSTGPAAAPGAGVRASASTMVPSSVTKRSTPARRAVTARRSCRPGRATRAGSTGRMPSSVPRRRASASGSRLRTALPLVRSRRRTLGRRNSAPALSRRMWRWRRRRSRRARRRSRRPELGGGGTVSLPARRLAGLRGNGGWVPSVISRWISRPSAVPSSAASQGCSPKTWSPLGHRQDVALDLGRRAARTRGACGPGPGRSPRWRRPRWP